jgi:hypothetical protein
MAVRVFKIKPLAVTCCGCAEARQKPGTDKRKIFWNRAQEKTLTDDGEGF